MLSTNSDNRKTVMSTVIFFILLACMVDVRILLNVFYSKRNWYYSFNRPDLATFALIMCNCPIVLIIFGFLVNYILCLRKKRKIEKINKDNKDVYLTFIN